MPNTTIRDRLVNRGLIAAATALPLAGLATAYAREAKASSAALSGCYYIGCDGGTAYCGTVVHPDGSHGCYKHAN